MLSKIVVIFRKPKPSPARRSGDDHSNNPRSSSALKIIHPGGTTEHYYMATPAARIIDEYYPSFILARPDVFRKPWESVVKRDEILTPGQKFFVVPRQTIKKLRRRSRRIKKGIEIVPTSNHASSSDQMISLAESSSGSFMQRSSIIKAASDEKTKQRSRRRVRFFGVDAVEGSSDFATSSESNGRRGSKSRREQRKRRARAWNPSLTVITEKMGEHQTMASEQHDDKRKYIVPSQLYVADTPPVKSYTPSAASLPSSPTGHRKTCLCSPTTHAGSFRCRYHRNTKLTRGSMSVAANLSELGSTSVANRYTTTTWCLNSPSIWAYDHVVPAKRAGDVPVLEPLLEAGRVENMPARQLVYLCIWLELCQANRALLLGVVRDAHCVIPDGGSSAPELLYVGLRGGSSALEGIQWAFDGVLFPGCNPDANDAKD
nr:Myeloid-associated differentiation marker-like protein [Ipomoea batatas]